MPHGHPLMLVVVEGEMARVLLPQSGSAAGLSMTELSTQRWAPSSSRMEVWRLTGAPGVARLTATFVDGTH